MQTCAILQQSDDSSSRGTCWFDITMCEEILADYEYVKRRLKYLEMSGGFRLITPARSTRKLRVLYFKIVKESRELYIATDL